MNEDGKGRGGPRTREQEEEEERLGFGIFNLFPRLLVVDTAIVE